MNGYLNHYVAARNSRALAALGELALILRVAELITLVGRLFLLLRDCETFCRRACVGVAP